jgi:hypothetical protein
MSHKADVARRASGVVFLLLALGMLLAGQTVLNDLQGVRFILFWLACLGFTLLAMIVALLDALIVRRRSRDEQRAFLQDTLREIARQGNAGQRRRPRQQESKDK